MLHLGLATWERECQARRLMETLYGGEKARQEAPPTALLGDFNMLRARSPVTDIFADHFPFCVRLPTYPVRRPRLSLDRIYLTSEWEIQDARVFDEGPALQASDHLPLVTEARVIT